MRNADPGFPGGELRVEEVAEFGDCRSSFAGFFGFGFLPILATISSDFCVILRAFFQGEFDLGHGLFLIQVSVDLVFGRSPGADAAFGDIESGDPDDGVEDDLAEVIDGPVAVEVAAGVAAAPRSIGTFKSPHHGLWFAESIAAVFVPEVGGDEGLFGGDAGEERDRFFVELKVVIPFVEDLDGFLDSAANGVFGGDGEVGDPEWIDREVVLKISADGGEVVVLAALVFLGMNAVVHEEESGAGLGDFHEALVVIALHGVGVGVDDDGVGAVENPIVLGPAGDDLGFDGEVGLGIERCRTTGFQ